MSTDKKADELLAECETAEDVRDLVANLLDGYLKIKADCEGHIEYMDRLDDDGDQPTPSYVADALQDIIYTIEEHTQ